MAGDDLVELKFRLPDGTDIGPSKHSPFATIASLKERIISQWPKEKENAPKNINEVKLINAGKILENSKTLGESRQPMAEISGAVITMLVVVPPPISDKNNEKLQENKPKMNKCSCTIM